MRAEQRKERKTLVELVSNKLRLFSFQLRRQKLYQVNNAQSVTGYVRSFCKILSGEETDCCFCFSDDSFSITTFDEGMDGVIDYDRVSFSVLGDSLLFSVKGTIPIILKPFSAQKLCVYS